MMLPPGEMQEAKEALKDLHRALAGPYGRRLKKAILYGSRARGDAVVETRRGLVGGSNVRALIRDGQKTALLEREVRGSGAVMTSDEVAALLGKARENLAVNPLPLESPKGR